MLCWSCAADPAVRQLYPYIRHPGRGGGGFGAGPANARGKLPAEPTLASPGTAEKVEVMRGRAERKESLFHPEDAPMDAESRELGVV